MSEPSTPGQRSIAEAFENLTPLPRNSKRWQTLTASVCYFIGKDMQAYDCANDPGFRNMLKSFEPRYNPPDRSTISGHYIPEVYEKEKTRIMKQMSSDLQAYAITTDGWSSRANHSSHCPLYWFRMEAM